MIRLMTEEYNRCPAGGAFTLQPRLKEPPATGQKAASCGLIQHRPTVHLKVSGLQGEKRRCCPNGRREQNL